MTQAHVEPLPTLSIKSKLNNKSDTYFVRKTVCRDTTSEKLNIYEFNMDLFDDGKTEEFLLFVSNFKTSLAAAEKLATGAKTQQICYIVSGEAINNLESLSDDVEGTNTLTVENIIKELDSYFPL